MEPVVNHIVVDIGEHEACADGGHNVLGQIQLDGVHNDVDYDIARHNREHQVVFVVGETMVHSVEEEVEGHRLGVVGQPVVFGVKEVSVEDVFENCPISISNKEVYEGLKEVGGPLSEHHNIDERSDPNDRHEPVRGACKHFKHWVVVDLDVSNGVDQMLGLVNECDVVFPLKSSLYELGIECFGEVKLKLRSQLLAFNSNRLFDLVSILADNDSDLVEVLE